jgi:hypothetical protein
MYTVWRWLNEKEPKYVATIDTTLNKIVVLDDNFVYNLLRYFCNTTGLKTSSKIKSLWGGKVDEQVHEFMAVMKRRFLLQGLIN